MKTNLTLKFAFAAVALVGSLSAHAQTVTWNRQAFGQQETDPCGGTFNWPNDNSWDIQQVSATACGQSYVVQPSNWSTATYPNSSNLDVIVGAPAPISLDIAVTLHSLTVQSGAGNINMTSASSFNVQNYDFQTDGIFTTSLNHGHGGASPIISIAGTFKKSAGGGVLDISGGNSNIYVNLLGGTVQVTSGTLMLSRGESTGATFTIAANGAVDLTNGSTFVDWSGTYGGTGAGVVQLNNGGIQIQSAGATLNFSGNLFQWAGGYFSAPGTSPTLTNIGTLNLVGSGDKAIGGGGFHNAGTIIQSGTGNLQFNGMMTNDANGTYVIRSDAGMGSDGEIDNYGTFKKSAGTGVSTVFAPGSSPDSFYFSLRGGTVEVDSGTLELGRSYPDSTGATFIVAAGAVLDLNSGGIFGQYAGTYTGTGAGTLRMTGGQIGINGAGATFNFQGNLFQWSGGNINLGAPLDNQGTITIAGDVGIGGAGFVNHGVIKGNGSISGSITNDGTLSPGLSPGKITLNGNYTQESTGVLNIEIGGYTAVTEYDQFAVSGSAALAGTLNLTLINGFRPKVNDVFQILTYGSFTGGFTTINFTGLTAQVIYAAGGITIKVLTVPDIPLNIATRLLVNPDPNQLIGGFIITGTQPKKVIIRAIGPSLAAFFNGVLADPTLQLFQGNTLLVSNDNWKIRDSDGSSQQAEVEATTVPPSNALESAIVATLAPGAYTAVLRGKGNTSGIAVVEAYDLDQNAKSKLANIATRGLVGTNENVMIGGFITGGNGQADSKVVIRAIGPSLAAFGIPNVLQDPLLELHNQNGTTIQTNDDWQQTQAAEISRTGLAPTDPRESAMVTTLPDGNYTAIVRGKNNATGVAVVEVYSVL